MSAAGCAQNAEIHARNDAVKSTSSVAQPSARIQSTSRTTKAQQAWLRLFDRTLGRSDSQKQRTSAYLAPTEGLPLVGGDYDVVEICPWPNEVVHISHNVFYCSQPFPVSKHPPSYRDDCGCDLDRCVAVNGTRATSSCINAYQDIVCDDSICFLGPECGNRMMQHYTLDLIRTRVGFGVVSGVAIPKDAFIIEYVGEVLLGPDARKRSDRRYQVRMKTKANWDGAKNVFIDAARCGNESRCINHSCKPNCALYELEWTNTSRLGIFAKTDIPPLQELTFRYSDAKLTMFACECGQPNCVAKRN